MSTWSELDDARIARENEKLNMAYAEGRKDEREASCIDELLAALKECAARLEIHSKHSEDLVALMHADSAIQSAEGAKS